MKLNSSLILFSRLLGLTDRSDLVSIMHPRRPWIIVIILFAMSCPLKSYGQEADHRDVWEAKIVPTYMAVQGIAIAGMWAPRFFDGTFDDGFFEARENNVLFWPHVTAELLTAGMLVTGAYGIYEKKSWGKPVSFTALGALAYTSVNSLNWALAAKERYPLAVPMIIGLSGSVISISILL